MEIPEEETEMGLLSQAELSSTPSMHSRKLQCDTLVPYNNNGMQVPDIKEQTIR